MKRRVARPLSVWTYHLRNKRKTVPVIVVLALAIFGISISVVLAGALIKTTDLRIQQYQYLVGVSPNHQKGYTSINQRIQTAIRQNSHWRATYPAVMLATSISGVLGPTQMTVYAIDYASLEDILNDLELQVIEGRLPAEHEARGNWLILGRLVADARGLSIGDEIGRDLDEMEWLPHRFRVAAIVEGPVNLSFASLHYLVKESLYEQPQSLLAIPKPGEITSLSQDLVTLEGEEVRVTTYEKEKTRRDEEFTQMSSIILTINLVLGFVFSLVVGLLNLLYYMQRLSELATLQAIGYGKRFLLRRVVLESLSLVFVSWLVGLTLAQLIFGFITLVFLGPGVTLTAWDARTLLFTAPIPLMAGISGAITVGWSLARLDPIAIIDRKG